MNHSRNNDLSSARTLTPPAQCYPRKQSVIPLPQRIIAQISTQQSTEGLDNPNKSGLKSRSTKEMKSRAGGTASVATCDAVCCLATVKGLHVIYH
ncbi:hypothetical protein CDAR_321341 [Caerostris darwini]|uniref:Uncharacterized protein n=1 Tax=Caerostris darwini TaxID=1538125 RepID=A0AAV4QS27_9ARAC|nr:hypothetical protein CDAR_321341 [Caerostris darwini]